MLLFLEKGNNCNIHSYVTFLSISVLPKAHKCHKYCIFITSKVVKQKHEGPSYVVGIFNNAADFLMANLWEKADITNRDVTYVMQYMYVTYTIYLHVRKAPLCINSSKIIYGWILE